MNRQANGQGFIGKRLLAGRNFASQKEVANRGPAGAEDGKGVCGNRGFS